jgi:hypothetical protein
MGGNCQEHCIILRCFTPPTNGVCDGAKSHDFSFSWLLSSVISSSFHSFVTRTLEGKFRVGIPRTCQHETVSVHTRLPSCKHSTTVIG